MTDIYGTAIDWDDVSGVMIDMDGTVFKGNKVIPGATEFIERLKARKLPFVFLTNNSSSSRAFYFDKLTRMGFDITMDNILTSVTATIGYLLKYRKGESVYPMGTPQFIEEIKEAGIRTDEKDPDIVLLSFDTTMVYERINNAYQFLKRGAGFIATHPDRLCPTENGYMPDIGPFIDMLEDLTGVKATVIGKPNRIMIEMAADRMNVPLEKMIMIGDRLYTDIKMASENGIRSIQVLTGERPEVHPDWVFSSVDDILR